MIDVAILGGSGFVGAELLRLCAGHPQLAATRLFGDSQAGAALADVHPHLALAYPGARVERFAPAALDEEIIPDQRLLGIRARVLKR